MDKTEKIHKVLKEIVLKFEVSNNLLKKLCMTLNKIKTNEGCALYSELIHFVADRIYKPIEKKSTMKVLNEIILKEYPSVRLKDLTGNYHEMNESVQFTQYSITEVRSHLNKLNLPYASYLLFDVT